MTKQQFEQAGTMARKGEYTFDNLHIFDGFGFAAFRVVCTMRDLAGLIVWQCSCLNGEWDSDNLAEIWNCRKKFTICG